jgi:urea transport system permease protein
MGAILEFVVIRHMYHRPLDTLLVTFGVALLLQQAARDIFGAPNVQVVAPEWLSGGVDVFGVTLPAARIFILVLVALCVGLLTLLVQRSSLGRRIRAVVQNRPLAEASGVPTARIDRTTFFIGSGLAGVAGVALTLLGSVGPTLGTAYIIDAFLVVVVGGIGHLRGAIIAAFALGMLQAVVEYSTTASFAKVIVFAAIVLFLQIRPQGIVSVRTRGLA